MFIPQQTQDGSFTFFSTEFNEAFHSHYGAKQESLLKFAIPTRLPVLAETGFVRLLDICYGLGYNTATALQTIWQVNPRCRVEVIGLELNPIVSQAAINHQLFNGWEDKYIKILTQIGFEHQVHLDYLQATLLIGDARNLILQVHESGFQADAIFLDPFSPPQCPQLWTVEFIQNVSECLDQNGLLATYSCAAAVRTALLTAGLVVGSTPPVGRRTPGTIAGYPQHGQGSTISSLPPLSQAEAEHLLTRAAIPYRDPNLSDTAEVILKRRQEEVQVSTLESSSQWRKRLLRSSTPQEILPEQSTGSND
ncbi:MAG: MnmC family methyltransferase [Aphanizomenon gracile PMC638.10]|nr:MnmC family methyltransferase [Aphanizomenon gracile PMC638.10]